MTVEKAATTASPALQAAQAQLMSRREQCRRRRQQEGMPLRTDANGRFLPPTSTSAASPTPLPPHLGWESSAVTTALRRNAARRGAPHNARPTVPEPQFPAGGCAPQTAVSPPPAPAPAAVPPTVRLYPDLALGMLRAQVESAGRIWLLLRHLDTQGQGWLPVARARKALTGKGAALRVCGWRQLRNLLREGEGIFWQRQRDRLWLRSVAKVAAALDVWRLHGRPVALPLSVLTQRIGSVRAHFYASFHSGRNRETAVAPIARATLQELTHVHPRTQRRYEQQVQVQRFYNFALGNRVSAADAEEQAWRHGQALFHFKDVAGRQGPAGATYLAWQLPNHYVGPHQPQPRSRQKGINRELADLLNQGMTGNGEQTEITFRQKRFYRDGKAAAQAMSRNPRQELYWPARQAHLWYRLESSSGQGRITGASTES